MFHKNVISIVSLIVLPLIALTAINQIKADNGTEQGTGGFDGAASTTLAPTFTTTMTTSEPPSSSSRASNEVTTISIPESSTQNNKTTQIVLETPTGTGNETSGTELSSSGDGLVTTTTSTTSRPQTTPMSQDTIEHLIKILSSERSDPSEPMHNFCDYMKPICETIDKITEKCTAKISKQLKKLVNLSTGAKLGSCFLEHYFFDPTATTVTKHDLNNICLSKNSAKNPKGHYKLFQHCAVKYWTPAIDKEIDKIQVSRLEYLRSNQHNKDKTTDMLATDHDEAKAINEIINKVLGVSANYYNYNNNDNNVGNKTNKSANGDIKIFNLNHNNSTNDGKNKTDKFNNSESLLVLVDNSKSKSLHSTTQAPAITTIAISKQQDEVGNNATKDTTTKELNSTLAPTKDSDANGDKSDNTTETVSTKITLDNNKSDDGNSTATTTITVNENNETTTTVRPAHISTTSSAAKKNTTITVKIEPATTTTTSTPKIQKSSKTTTQTPKLNSLFVTFKPKETDSSSKNNKTDNESSEDLSNSATTTSSPVKLSTTTTTFNSDRIDFKASLEKKLREERDRMLKLLKRNQDELDALTAMKSLQAQKQKMVVVQHDHSDDRVHQIEHNRQMAMDPIGHMRKHQQYESLKKQSG